jgi:hypothetical protein
VTVAGKRLDGADAVLWLVVLAAVLGFVVDLVVRHVFS